jgi:hypothetical protein
MLLRRVEEAASDAAHQEFVRMDALRTNTAIRLRSRKLRSTSQREPLPSAPHGGDQRKQFPVLFYFNSGRSVSPRFPRGVTGRGVFHEMNGP